MTEPELLDKICGLLGGRVSEDINFGEASTGASNDFERATQIARSMVTEYGMSKKLDHYNSQAIVVDKYSLVKICKVSRIILVKLLMKLTKKFNELLA